MPWKMAVVFSLCVLLLCLISFALQGLGWYDLSRRFYAYMALCVVGFFISWLCLAFINVRRLFGRWSVEDE